MARITRRERIGLLALLVICALILGVLALRRPTPVVAIEVPAAAVDSAGIYKSNGSNKSNESNEPNKSYKTYKEHKSSRDSIRKKGSKKPRKAPLAPRRHLDEPF